MKLPDASVLAVPSACRSAPVAGSTAYAVTVLATIGPCIAVPDSRT